MSKLVCYYETVGRVQNCPGGGALQCSICAFFEGRLKALERERDEARAMYLGDLPQSMDNTDYWQARAENAERVLRDIRDVYDMRTDIFPSEIECAASLADRARAALRHEEE